MASDGDKEDDQDDETVGEVLLKKQSSAGVQYEAVFTTALVTMMLATFPSGRFRDVIFGAAGLLLLILAIRFLAVNGRFADTKSGLATTYRPMELLSVIGVFYLTYQGIEYTSTHLPWTLPQPIATTFGSLVLTLLVILVIERIQRIYRLWWGTIFYLKARALKANFGEADSQLISYLFTNVFGQMAYYLLKDSIPATDEPELNELREFVSNVEDSLEEEQEVSPFRLMVFSGLFVIPMYLFLAWILSLILGPAWDIFVVLLGVWVLQHIISFLYITNGASSFSTWLQPSGRSIGTTFLFTGIVYWIFFF